MTYGKIYKAKCLGNDMVNPKISIIVPVYNLARYLPGAVESLDRQTADDGLWEAVFVDDKSGDNSLGLLNDLTIGKKNMRVVARDVNGGLFAARNTGIEYANGEFIAQLDGDDKLEPKAMEIVDDYLGRNQDVKYFYSSHKRVDEDGKLIEDRPSITFSSDELLHFNFVAALKGYDRGLNDQIGGFRTTYAEDWDHALRAREVLSPEQFGQISDFLYLYTFDRASSIVNSTPDETKRADVCTFLKPYVERSVGEEVDVFWSHMTDRKFNYYDWRAKEDA